MIKTVSELLQNTCRLHSRTVRLNMKDVEMKVQLLLVGVWNVFLLNLSVSLHVHAIYINQSLILTTFLKRAWFPLLETLQNTKLTHCVSLNKSIVLINHSFQLIKWSRIFVCLIRCFINDNFKCWQNFQSWNIWQIL